MYNPLYVSTRNPAFCSKYLAANLIQCDWKWLLYLETCQTHDQTKAQEFYLPPDTILLIAY